MTTELLRQLIEVGLDRHQQYLLAIARLSIEIAPSTEVGTMSRFGGDPELPADFEWPEHALGPYRFIGQFDLAELPEVDHGLPRDGLLSIFQAHDDDGESFWRDPDFVRIYRFDRPQPLTRRAPPAAVRFAQSIGVRFAANADLPPWPFDDAARDWPIDASLEDAYWELRCRLHPSGRYLLGYPFNTTLAYDPTPGPGWHSLLTLSSDDDLEWCWHDGDWLVTFIEMARLRVGDFSQIRADAG